MSLDAILRGVGMFMDDRNNDANRVAQQQNAANNVQLQRDFAQMGIQWKVEDANRAGIHPLYALGAQTHSFSPVSIGDQPTTNYARDMGAMGQDLTRAINATRTQSQRDEAFEKTVKGLQLEKATLENDALRTNIASSVQRLKQTGSPPMPSSADGPQVAKKWEDMPRLRMGGEDVQTNPNTTNTEDAEKRYGDDGPASWLWGLGTMWNDYKKTTGTNSMWEAADRGAARGARWMHDQTKGYPWNWFGRR